MSYSSACHCTVNSTSQMLTNSAKAVNDKICWCAGVGEQYYRALPGWLSYTHTTPTLSSQSTSQ